ncbi:TPA: hypothetical protein ACGO8L_001334, partial [Streptococcus suis]
FSFHLLNFENFDLFTALDVSLGILGLYGAYLTIIQFLVGMAGDDSKEDRYLGKSRSMIIIEQNAYITLTRKFVFTTILIGQLIIPFIIKFIVDNFPKDTTETLYFNLLLFWQTSALLIIVIFVLIVVVNIELPITALFMTERRNDKNALTKSIENSVIQDFAQDFQYAVDADPSSWKETLSKSLIFHLDRIQEADQDEFLELVYYGMSEKTDSLSTIVQYQQQLKRKILLNVKSEEENLFEAFYLERWTNKDFPLSQVTILTRLNFASFELKLLEGNYFTSTKTVDKLHQNPQEILDTIVYQIKTGLEVGDKQEINEAIRLTYRTLRYCFTTKTTDTKKTIDTLIETILNYNLHRGWGKAEIYDLNKIRERYSGNESEKLSPWTFNISETGAPNKATYFYLKLVQSFLTAIRETKIDLSQTENSTYFSQYYTCLFIVNDNEVASVIDDYNQYQKSERFTNLIENLMIEIGIYKEQEEINHLDFLKLVKTITSNDYSNKVKNIVGTFKNLASDNLKNDIDWENYFEKYGKYQSFIPFETSEKYDSFKHQLNLIGSEMEQEDLKVILYYFNLENEQVEQLKKTLESIEDIKNNMSSNPVGSVPPIDRLKEEISKLQYSPLISQLYIHDSFEPRALLENLLKIFNQSKRLSSRYLDSILLKILESEDKDDKR